MSSCPLGLALELGDSLSGGGRRRWRRRGGTDFSYPAAVLPFLRGRTNVRNMMIGGG